MTLDTGLAFPIKIEYIQYESLGGLGRELTFFVSLSHGKKSALVVDKGKEK